MRRKKSIPSFIDNKKYFTERDGYKKGAVVFYKRLSDDEVSSGVIKWFEMTREEKVIITLIDDVLKNYQSCYLDDIIKDPDRKTVEKVRKKI